MQDAGDAASVLLVAAVLLRVVEVAGDQPWQDRLDEFGLALPFGLLYLMLMLKAGDVANAEMLVMLVMRVMLIMPVMPLKVMLMMPFGDADPG